MNAYLGLFLVCFSGCALEVTLVRLLSVTTWYHLAFFAISTAMLGMTAGATRVYLRPREFDNERLTVSVSRSCIYFALSIPVTLLVLCLVPLDVHYQSIMFFLSLLTITAACALPFFFAGTVISGVLTKQNLPIGKLYASDLIGASLGCLFVLGGMEVFDAPSLILLCSCPAALAAMCFSWKEPSTYRRMGFRLFLLFLLIGVANSFTSGGIRPLVIKGTFVEPSSVYYLEKWNSFSRIAVYEKRYALPQYWGPSPLAPKELIEQHRMNIDGDAATNVSRFNSSQDIDYLRYDVTNIAYSLGRKGDACIIGVGGGRDVQSACLFEHHHVTGIEINPIFVDLLKKEFRTFAGLADHPHVTLVTAEARSYLSQRPEKYSIIQMSLIDTWAATGAGAFSLSENSLYTVQAWKLFIDRLQDNGVFTVSRWYNSKNIGETGRVLSLAVASLLQSGIKDPSEHLALITAKTISTLLISRQPLANDDVRKLVKTTKHLRFKTICVPGQLPEDSMLRAIVSARTPDELSAAIESSTLNYSPPTDENPYFFNLLRLSNIRAFSKGSGVIQGNLYATLTLLGLLLTLFLITICAIVLPLTLRKRFAIDTTVPSRMFWFGALYFSLIGCGFMLTEISLIQRLTVLLSHPLYALGILLFTLIASTGIGSLLSDGLPLVRRPWLYLYPILTAGCLIGLNFLLNHLLATMINASISLRIVASVVVIFPMGLLMGLFFPTGMRLVNYVSSSETPWYWALNGIFGVLSSAIAVLISIYVGISTNFFIAAICYTAILIAQVGLRRANEMGR
jgi:hypothetical protein